MPQEREIAELVLQGGYGEVVHDDSGLLAALESLRDRPVPPIPDAWRGGLHLLCDLVAETVEVREAGACAHAR